MIKFEVTVVVSEEEERNERKFTNEDLKKLVQGGWCIPGKCHTLGKPAFDERDIKIGAK